MKTIRGITDMVKAFENVKMATTATRLFGDLKFVLEERQMEHKKFFEGEGEKVKFANTKTQFEIGDNVEVNGKEYEIYEFYQSVHAQKNEIDWLRLRRAVEGTTFWANVNPSEAKLLSRPVPSAGGNPGNFTEFPNE